MEGVSVISLVLLLFQICIFFCKQASLVAIAFEYEGIMLFGWDCSTAEQQLKYDCTKA